MCDGPSGVYDTLKSQQHWQGLRFATGVWGGECGPPEHVLATPNSHTSQNNAGKYIRHLAPSGTFRASQPALPLPQWTFLRLTPIWRLSTRP